MPFRRILPFAAVALIASACNDSPTVVQTPDSSVRVINAGGVPLNILIDGVAVEQASASRACRRRFLFAQDRT
jgi:hypothetical protein